MLNSQVLSQTSQVRPWVKSSLLVVGASLLIGLSAHIKIPLPFTPIPISMQSFTVLFLATFLGSKRGSLAVLAYLMEGILGFPVFSGGNAGLAYFMGVTGGYLVGFVFAAFATGWIIERTKKSLSSAFIAWVVGDLIIYACGLAWLSQFVGGMKAAFLLGMLPFLIGSSAKLLLALSGIKTIRAFKT